MFYHDYQEERVCVHAPNDNLLRFGAATGGELYDPEYCGGEWMVEAVETAETLAHWEQSSRGWAERSPMRSGEIAGFPFRAWKSAQALPGQPRQAMSVIDLGDMRIALPGTDLSLFV